MKINLQTTFRSFPGKLAFQKEAVRALSKKAATHVFSKKTMADIVLLIVCISWGFAFPLMHMCVKAVGVYFFVSLKYFFAILAFLPFVVVYKEKSALIKLLPHGALLGFLYFTACLFQAYGLERISAGRNAFITSLIVVLTPLLSPFFLKTYPKKIDILNIILVLIGMYILLNPFHEHANMTGDILSFVGTIFFALHMQTLQKLGKKYKEPVLFGFYQVFFIFIFGTITLFFFEKKSIVETIPHISSIIWGLLALLGAGVVGVSFFIQAKFQPRTSPTRAALIYNLQPAIAAFAAYLILGEMMSRRSVIGAGIVVFSVLGAQIYRHFRDMRLESKNLTSTF